jgi:pteridine reductase
MNDESPAGKVALITGGARRVGAVVCRTLHAEGMNLAIHYRSSAADAQALKAELEAVRPESVQLIQGDLLEPHVLPRMIEECVGHHGRLDVLINNASSFYPTPVGRATEDQWRDLMGTNAMVPFFLSQAAAPHLRASGGTIVSIADIHAERPLKNHTIYSMAKAGLVMMTKSLACELGPTVRVNAIAPGAILWPENEMDDATREKIISRTFLKRQGSPDDIARAVRFLVCEAGYLTGQVLAIDGGRSLNS